MRAYLKSLLGAAAITKLFIFLFFSDAYQNSRSAIDYGFLPIYVNVIRFLLYTFLL